MSMSPTVLNRIASCYSCSACVGAQYQMSPQLIAGNATDPAILIIAQNPGEIQEGDKVRARIIEMAKTGMFDTPEAMKAIYDVDFGTSPACKRMAAVFGDGWFESGRFAYTNAVRCRTPKNASPSNEMVTNCSVWTKAIISALKPRGLVLLGQVAYAQLFPAGDAPIDVMEMKRHKTYGPILRFPHFSAWRFEDTYQMQELFKSFNTRIK